MPRTREKIEKTIRAIAKAESRGKDTTDWQVYLLELIDQFHDSKIKVKVGKFGFCTCTESSGVCVGVGVGELDKTVIVLRCWLIPKSK